MVNKIQKRVRRSRSIRIDITNQIGDRGEFQPLDQGATFPDRVHKLKVTNFREFSFGAFNDSERVIPATIQNDNNFPALMVILAEILCVLAQNGPNPLLLVVSGNKQQK